MEGAIARCHCKGHAPREREVRAGRVVFGALAVRTEIAPHWVLPGVVPAEGASALWNIQISARPKDAGAGLPQREVLMFNSGGTGARPGADGLSATAFPSGVSLTCGPAAARRPQAGSSSSKASPSSTSAPSPATTQTSASWSSVSASTWIPSEV